VFLLPSGFVETEGLRTQIVIENQIRISVKETIMKRTRSMIGILAIFLAAAVAGVAVAKKNSIAPDLYMGKNPAEAASALMNTARPIAGDGSWENIHLARVYYLAGQKDKAQAILDGVLGGKKAGAGEWIRAGRVYYQAGEWDKAKAMFEKVIAAEPKDEDWLAEIGAYYNLQGEREQAEEYFQRCFALGTSLKNVLSAAGSYEGVEPRRR
jgi:tetratricopeptide (TPR) repeat protein